MAMALQRQDAEQIVERIAHVRASAAVRPRGIQYRRISPITWSMRSAPAWRMLARSVAMNGA